MNEAFIKKHTSVITDNIIKVAS